MMSGPCLVIRRFATDVITVTRPGASSYDAHGVASFAAATVLSTSAHVECPASVGDLKHLPEGDRIRRSCSVWSTLELRHRDLVTLESGEIFEVQSVEPWHKLAGFWKALGLKQL